MIFHSKIRLRAASLKGMLLFFMVAVQLFFFEDHTQRKPLKGKKKRPVWGVACALLLQFFWQR